MWLKEREPRNRMIRERVESSKSSDRTTAAEALAADTEEAGDAADGAPLAPHRRRRTGVATAPRPTTSAAIPPRPRKKGRRR